MNKEQSDPVVEEAEFTQPQADTNELFGYQNEAQPPAEDGNNLWGDDAGFGNSGGGFENPPMDQFNAGGLEVVGQKIEAPMGGMGGGEHSQYDHLFSDDMTEEEKAHIMEVHDEQKGRLQRVQQKAEEEYQIKRQRQEEAQKWLTDYYSGKTRETDQRRQSNIEQQNAYIEQRDDHKQSKNPWEKIIDNVEIQENKYAGNFEVKRMRAAMMARR